MTFSLCIQNVHLQSDVNACIGDHVMCIWTNSLLSGEASDQSGTTMNMDNTNCSDYIPSLTTDNTSDISYIELYNISQSKGNLSILKMQSISIVLQCPWQSLSCNHARHHLTPTSSIFSFLHVQPEIPSGHETTHHQWIMTSRSNATMKFYCFYLQLNIHISDWQSYSCNGHWTN